MSRRWGVAEDDKHRSGSGWPSTCFPPHPGRVTRRVLRATRRSTGAIWRGRELTATMNPVIEMEGGSVVSRELMQSRRRRVDTTCTASLRGPPRNVRRACGANSLRAHTMTLHTCLDWVTRRPAQVGSVFGCTHRNTVQDWRGTTKRPLIQSKKAECFSRHPQNRPGKNTRMIQAVNLTVSRMTKDLFWVILWVIWEVD